MKANVTYWLDETAARFPDKTAYADENKEITFSELWAQARAIASELTQRGLFKKPVAIFLEKGVDVLVSFMGAAYSCNFYSPIDVDMPGSRVNKILEVLEPAVVITTGTLREVFSAYDYKGELLLLEEVLVSDVQDDALEAARGKGIDTDLLYVLFTSGSTGVPKGVTINHRAVIDYIDWVTETFDITEKDSFGNQAPFYFDNSILDIYSTLKTGATTYIIPKTLFAQPVLLLEYLKEKKINTIFWVPSALIVVAKLKAFKNVDLSDTLRRVLFCGEVMPNKQLNVWRRFLPDVQYANLYGPTEITDACTYYIVDREFSDEEPLPIGFPMPNTDILVLNEENESVTGEEPGELCVRGTSLSMGYYKNPEKTKEAFVQNPLNQAVPELIYRTGDVVKYNERGEIVYLSRKDFQIKHMGHRIELGEIETAVSSLPEISLNCCLYDEKRQKIVLFIEEELEKAYINEKISHLVPEYMLPNKVVRVEKMPINANGKIDRVKLKEYIAK
ncbi:MAG: D-alanine--poly(phosphoribitol) ligase [Lachnospiraceae bacterium]|jgi:D-alanine--poly(phosphoribitol) ligase subunit 1|nr:D-alanine--poly(phosphoribitol) ligase [Lachnospiraceae bacterium]